jgi:hypothetical protein
MNQQDKTPELSKDIIEAASAMENSEMESLLLQLGNTRFWVAIIKYNASRSEMAKNGLYTLDPFKDQTQLARFQGLLAGLIDLQSMVLMLEARAKKQEGAKKDA